MVCRQFLLRFVSTFFKNFQDDFSYVVLSAYLNDYSWLIFGSQKSTVHSKMSLLQKMWRNRDVPYFIFQAELHYSFIENTKIFTSRPPEKFSSKTTCWIAAIYCIFGSLQYGEGVENPVCAIPYIPRKVS